MINYNNSEYQTESDKNKQTTTKEDLFYLKSNKCLGVLGESWTGHQSIIGITHTHHSLTDSQIETSINPRCLLFDFGKEPAKAQGSLCKENKNKNKNKQNLSGFESTFILFIFYFKNFQRENHLH